MLLRSLVVVHRYLGVLLGVLMTLWCLSGFVMMYQSFPELTTTERLQGLAPLELEQCCAFERLPIGADATVTEARLEMAAGSPILRITLKGEKPVVFDAASGSPKPSFSAAETLRIAAAYGQGHGISAPPMALGPIDVDQWTVGSARRNAPVHHFRFGDERGTEIYVSARSGEVFQDTDRKERVLSWLGAIPHWLYPTMLRENVEAWSQVVIWTSLLGVFLTATGLYVGATRIGRGRAGQLSPYKGLWYWHHLTGLVFGVATLTWVFSGLLTMSPWGFLESGGPDLRAQIRGAAPWSEVQQALRQAPARAVQLTVSPLGGETRLLATASDGGQTRLAADGAARPVTRSEVLAALQSAKLRLAALQLIADEDAYYYGHHTEVALPVWRAQLNDADHTRVYIDAASGVVRRAVDAEARQSRWLQSALHDFDWPVLRERPIWDLVVLPLLLGVTLVCALGAWMGLRRIPRDVRALQFALRGRRRRSASGSTSPRPVRSGR